MSSFECAVVRVKIAPHPNADAIEIAQVGDYQSIVKKGQFKNGSLAVYIPEQAVLPEWLLKSMGFWDAIKGKGALSGSLGNRVRAIKLRGVLSQGIVLGGVQFHTGDELVVGCPDAETGGHTWCHMNFAEGQDAAEFLGIVKYEPALPSHMKARVIGVDYENTHHYDFDNLKKKPELFEDGEDVVITEKIHGTLIQVGVVPSKSANEKYYGGRVVVSSKGMGRQGYILDHDDPTNLYAQAAKKAGLFDAVLDVLGPVADSTGRPVFIVGEVYGKTPSGAGVQDLTYGGEELAFAAFDICVGNRGSEAYYPWTKFLITCIDMKVRTVPLLYIGPYSKEVVLEHTDGKDTISGTHIREGVVVKSVEETPSQHFGRKIAKSVSEAYLLRKGEVTEFQ